MEYKRKLTKQIKIGSVAVGGGTPVAVQSMTNTPTDNVEATVAQIQTLCNLKCDIVRLAVPDEAGAKAIEKIKNRVSVPIVADIHFDHKLALMCMERGVDKIRINPGNIGGENRVGEVAKMAMEKRVPIRIGVNGGSLEKEILLKYGQATPEAMVESAMYHIGLLNKFDFDDIVISLKASSVKTTIEAYRLMSERTEYPLHIGVTEAGISEIGLVKSAIGIGSLLVDGIGDTVRVSLTGDPAKEVEGARLILKALGLGGPGVEVVSCPTCGRCKIDLIAVAETVSKAVEGLDKPLKVAVMGCVVNGPGEAREADVGIAGGDGCAVLFKKGEIMGRVDEDKIVETLLKEINQMK